MCELIERVNLAASSALTMYFYKRLLRLLLEGRRGARHRCHPRGAVVAIQPCHITMWDFSRRTFGCVAAEKAMGERLSSRRGLVCGLHKV